MTAKEGKEGRRGERREEGAEITSTVTHKGAAVAPWQVKWSRKKQQLRGGGTDRCRGVKGEKRRRRRRWRDDEETRSYC